MFARVAARVTAAAARPAVARVPVRCTSVAVRATRSAGRWVLGASRAHARSFASMTLPTASAGGNDGASDAEQEEYRAKVLAMQKQAQEEAAAHEAEMKKLYGDEEPALNWMHSYLQSPHPEFMVAATNIAGSEDGLSDSVEAAFIHFVAQLLRGSEDDAAVEDYASRCFLIGCRPDLVMAVLHQVNSPKAQRLKTRLVESVAIIKDDDGGENFAARFGHALTNVPVKDIMAWPITFTDLELSRQLWREGASTEFHMTGFFHHTLPTLSGAVGTAEEEKAFLAWVTSTSKTLVDSLWGHYWATGDTGYVRRIISLAVPWHEFSATTDIGYVLEGAVGVPENMTALTEEAMRCMVSAATFHSLMLNSRVHRGVVRALIDEVSTGADVFLGDHLRADADSAKDSVTLQRVLFATHALNVLARLQEVANNAPAAEEGNEEPQA